MNELLKKVRGKAVGEHDAYASCVENVQDLQRAEGIDPASPEAWETTEKQAAGMAVEQIEAGECECCR